MKRAFLALLLTSLSLAAVDFQAGVARVKITPPVPFWLSGYAARTNPAPVVLQELWAKALAIRDPQGGRVVLVTMDLIGLPQEVCAAVARRANTEFKLERSELVLNCSHTHSGPAVGSNLNVLFEFNAADQERVKQYSGDLTENLVRVIGDALRNESPATLAAGSGSAGFGVNRRVPADKGYKFGANTNGPMDPTVAVLRVTAPDGKLRAVLFGYGCHNTTLGGNSYQVNGDYAGFAQAEFEQAHPGVTGMFLMLCGGDQNPNPRGTVELVQAHGKTLAAEVDRVLGAELRAVSPPIRTASEVIQLEFAPHTRESFEAELKSPDKFRKERARQMLAAYDRGEPVRQTPYPVQAVRFNEDLTLVALGGEVVVDYSLRAKREFAGENLIVSGFCNEVMCYIPSKRLLQEGGYEPVESMIYYGMPGPFAGDVEEKVFASIRKVLERAGAKPAANRGKPSSQ